MISMAVSMNHNTLAMNHLTLVMNHLTLAMNHLTLANQVDITFVHYAVCLSHRIV